MDYAQSYGLFFLGRPVWSQDSVILMGCFQLWIFYEILLRNKKFTKFREFLDLTIWHHLMLLLGQQRICQGMKTNLIVKKRYFFLTQCHTKISQNPRLDSYLEKVLQLISGCFTEPFFFSSLNPLITGNF